MISLTENQIRALGKINYNASKFSGCYVVNNKSLYISHNEINGIPIKYLILNIENQHYKVGIHSENYLNHLCYVIDVPLLGEQKITIKILFEETQIRNVILEFKNKIELDRLA